MVVCVDEVTAFLHAEIPLTRAMALRVTHWDGQALKIAAPLPENSNHEDTAFGGSLATLGIVAGWTWVHLKLKEAGLTGRLLISRSEMVYLKPVAGDLSAVCRDGGQEWERFVRSVRQRGRGRIRMRAEVGDGATVGAVHDGVYVVAGTTPGSKVPTPSSSQRLPA